LLECNDSLRSSSKENLSNHRECRTKKERPRKSLKERPKCLRCKRERLPRLTGWAGEDTRLEATEVVEVALALDLRV
jgi:hypothetical protein